MIHGYAEHAVIASALGGRRAGQAGIQLELAQCTYMDEDTFEYLPECAAPVQALIRRLLECCLVA